MKELFDDRLSQKIRQTFDNHEEPYSAQGWEMMQQQMKAQKSGKVKAILLSFPAKIAAAAVLVIGGVFTYKSIDSNLNNPSYKQNAVYAQNDQKRSNQKRTDQDKEFEGVQVLPPSIDGEHTQTAQNQQNKSQDKKAVSPTNIPDELTKPDKLRAGTAPDFSSNNKMEKNNQNVQLVRTVAINNPDKNNKINVVKLDKNTQVKTIPKYNINTLAVADPDMYTNVSAESTIPAISMAGFQAVDVSKVAQYDEKNLRANRPVKLGLLISSLVNYSDKGEKDSQVNLGAGVLSEFSLGKKFSITSGVILTKQSLEMNKPANLPMFATTQNLGTNQVFQNRFQEQNRSISMQFVGLDFPINIQYHIGKNVNKGLFVSVGVSSLAYLQEDYTHTTRETIQRSVYKPGVLSPDDPQTIETYVSETSLKSNPESLSRFDFARMLNVSMGMKYMVANNMQILIEPYLKYPLGTLTSERLRFGSAGVNLRCSFN